MVERPVVALLGGTFDPVHLGHLGLAEHVRESTGVARVLFLPCAVPPHKSPRHLTPARHREAMLRLALAGREGLELCTLELRTRRVCYTIDSLRRLRNGRPPVEPVFVMGLDSLLDLTSWRDYQSIVREFDLIVVDRACGPTHGPVRAELDPLVARALVELPVGPAGLEAWRDAEAGRGGRVFVVRMTPIPISSSLVRSRAAAGDSLARLVPPDVARYIERWGLYTQEESR